MTRPVGPFCRFATGSVYMPTNVHVYEHGGNLEVGRRRSVLNWSSIGPQSGRNRRELVGTARQRTPRSSWVGPVFHLVEAAGCGLPAQELTAGPPAREPSVAIAHGAPIR